MLDLTLAVAHHVLAFGLAAMLMAEFVLVRPGMRPEDAAKAARLDAGYGATAGLLVVVGVGRLVFGAKGWAWYADNPFFWAKMASFGLIALLSVPPTRRFLAWRRAMKDDAAFTPSPDEIAKVRRLLRAQSLLLVSVLAFAASMARFSGF